MFLNTGLPIDVFLQLGPVGSDPLGDLFPLAPAQPNEPSSIVCKVCDKGLPQWIGALIKCPTACCCGVQFHDACMHTLSSQKTPECPNCTNRVPLDREACTEHLQKHSKQGQAWAECSLGECYLYGDSGVEQSFKKALELFERSAAQGYVVAIYTLAQLFVLGHQKVQDKKPGLDLSKDLRGCLLGHGIPPDIERGLDLYALAGRANHPEALLACFEWYMHGQYGVAKNQAKAKALVLKLVEYSFDKAQQRVSLYHFTGSCGFEINYSKARMLLEQSAKGGLQESIAALNTMKKNKICAACQRPEVTPFLASTPMTFNRCGGCKLQYYCNSTCQKNHWTAGHKKECKRLKKKYSGRKDTSSSSSTLFAEAAVHGSSHEAQSKRHETLHKQRTKIVEQQVKGTCVLCKKKTNQLVGEKSKGMGTGCQTCTDEMHLKRDELSRQIGQGKYPKNTNQPIQSRPPDACSACLQHVIKETAYQHNYIMFACCDDVFLCRACYTDRNVRRCSSCQKIGGLLVLPFSKKNIKQLKHKVKKNKVWAMVELSLAYEENRGNVRQSDQQALKYRIMAGEAAEKAVKAAAAINNLEHRFTCPRGIARALTMYAKMVYYGQLNYNGGRHDIKGSVYWYELAAEYGDPTAQHNLGTLISIGEGGTLRDEDRARRLWSAAVQQGMCNSMYCLVTAANQKLNLGRVNIPCTVCGKQRSWVDAGQYKPEEYMLDGFPPAFNYCELCGGGAWWCSRECWASDRINHRALCGEIQQELKDAGSFRSRYLQQKPRLVVVDGGGQQHFRLPLEGGAGK